MASKEPKPFKVMSSFVLDALFKRKSDVILINGSSENVVSLRLVKVMNLNTTKHLNPYKIGQIKNMAKEKVIKVCKVPLSIGKYYEDEVMYDVIKMDAYHVLFRDRGNSIGI